MKKILILLGAIIITNCGIQKNKPSKDFNLGNSVDKPFKTEKISESNIYQFDSITFIPRTFNCEDTLQNEELKKCVSKSLSYFMNRKFNASLASNLGLKAGKHTITTEFIINKNGEIVNIKSIDGGHPRLNTEARRVINQIPTLLPGKLDEKPINVHYVLTVKFMVE